MRKLLQHVTDPELCIQCSECEMACPVKAIKAFFGRYCIDAEICDGCNKCIEECPTGAADRFIEVSEYYSQDQQSQWQKLPG